MERTANQEQDVATSNPSSARRATFAAASGVVVCGILFLIVNSLSTSERPSDLVWTAAKAILLAIIPGIIIAAFINVRVVDETSSRVAKVVQRDIVGSISHEIDSLLPGRERYGLVRIHDSMPYADLFGQLKAGDELLWLDTYWPTAAEFRERIRSALLRGARMRMLVIDPTCDNAGYRADELSATDEVISRNFREEAAAFIQAIARLFTTIMAGVPDPSSAEIRVYHDLPGLPIYIVLRDGALYRGYSSLFLTRPTGFGYPHFEWNPVKGPSEFQGFLEEMRDYFEQKWSTQAIESRGGGVIFPPPGGASAP